MIPLDLPYLPLECQPDGTVAKVKPIKYGRWQAEIWDRGYKIDILIGDDLAELVDQISIEYPHTTFDPERHLNAR